MVRQVNSFALLDDEEGDDLMALVSKVAAKAPPLPTPEEKKPPQLKNQQYSSVPPTKVPSKPLTLSESVRTERGRGRSDRGWGQGRGGLGGDVAEEFGNGRSNGYQRNFRGEFDGPTTNENPRGRGRGMGRGRPRGRSTFNDDRHLGKVNNQVDGGNDNQVHDGVGGEQGVEAQDEKLTMNESRFASNENRSYRNGNRNSGEGRGYGRESRGFRGGENQYYGSRETRGRNWYGQGEEGNESGEKEEASEGKREQNGNDEVVAESDVPETTEVPKETEPEAVVPQGVPVNVPEEDKEMTLVEYEKLLSEKRKSLEALKLEERKVALDKDLEMMQLIERKKESDIHFVKMKSEKDKLKKKDHVEKEDKVRKSVSITEFLKPAEGERYHGRGGRGRGQGERGSGRFRGDFSRDSGAQFDRPTLDLEIKDPNQFPLLGGAVLA